MPAGRQEARAAALALAVALHVLVFLLAMHLLARPRRSDLVEDPFMMAIRIPEERIPEQRPPPESAKTLRRRTAPQPLLPPQPEEPRTSAITLPPEPPRSVDWYREAEITVKSMDEASRQPSLRSEPEVMTLPRRDEGPHRGDSGVLPNGNIVVQTIDTVRCESGPVFAADVFEIWARTAPVRCTYKAKLKKELNLKDHDYGKEEEIQLP